MRHAKPEEPHEGRSEDDLRGGDVHPPAEGDEDQDATAAPDEDRPS